MKNKKLYIISLIAFIIYICFLLYLTLFKNYLGRTIGEYEINLIPFKNIFIIFKEFINNNVSLRFFIRNIFGNIVAFTPFAYFLPQLFKIKNKKTFGVTLLLIIIFIESMQLIFKIGYFDIDDIILNFIGSYLTFIILMKGVLDGKY